MVSIVRQSKYRHVFGEELKVKFEEVKSTALASEGTLVVSNGKYSAFCWETSGPGTLAVVANSEAGRIPPNHPWIKGHTANISDFEFNPYNDNEIITGCDDSLIRLWRLSGDKIHEEINTPLTTLQGHSRKISVLNFHPAAAYVLASASHDKTVKVWNVERAQEVLSFGGVTDNVLSLMWSPHGKSVAFTTRDKFARGIDPRSNRMNFEFMAHDGSKPSKLNWINEHTVVTCGFSKAADRQLAVWDLRNDNSQLKIFNIDQGSGVLYPFYDPDTSCLFVSGKGDGNIRYYEIVGDSNYMYYLESFKSNVPCKGSSFLPKRAVDVSVCEIMRAVKLTNNTLEFISFRVPRRSEAFQEDIYPDCISTFPSMRAEEWLNGHNKEPIRVPIKDVTSTTQVEVEIKQTKTIAEYERELKEAHEEIARLKHRISHLESRLG